MAEPAEAQSQEAFEAKLAAAVERAFGSGTRVAKLRAVTSGGAKQTWLFDRVDGGGATPTILQLASTFKESEAGDPAGQLPWTAGAEDLTVMQVASVAGVSVPKVLYRLTSDDGLGEGGFIQFVSGETLGRRIVTLPGLETARRRFAGQAGSLLARIHAVDPDRLPFLQSFEASRFLEIYSAIVEQAGLENPALLYCLRWAQRNLPPPGRKTLVHGDFRNGNLIVNENGIAAVLDWELAHFSEPEQDLGWLCVRTWRFGGVLPVAGVGSREALYSAYVDAGGALDPARVRFWEVVGGLRWAISCVRRAEGYASGRHRSLEAAAIARRIEEPLYDLLDVIEA